MVYVCETWNFNHCSKVALQSSPTVLSFIWSLVKLENIKDKVIKSSCWVFMWGKSHVGQESQAVNLWTFYSRLRRDILYVPLSSAVLHSHGIKLILCFTPIYKTNPKDYLQTQNIQHPMFNRQRKQWEELGGKCDSEMFLHSGLMLLDGTYTVCVLQCAWAFITDNANGFTWNVSWAKRG